MTGCTNPSAANYTQGATTDDLSCLYVRKVASTCYLFRDAQDNEREDFTASYSLLLGDWAFFHGYVPDHYIIARNQLYSLKDNEIYKHNSGPYGQYYGPKQSFFIDIVVTNRKEEILSALQWITEALDSTGKDKEHKTFTHVTIWNNYQCTGRILLQDIFLDLKYQTHRKSKGIWSFNDFRDILVDNEAAFLKDIFNDYAVDETKVNTNLPWYERKLLIDDHFIIRLEYDNTENLNLMLHQYGAVMDKSM